LDLVSLTKARLWAPMGVSAVASFEIPFENAQAACR
jgi:hypothetical protein